MVQSLIASAEVVQEISELQEIERLQKEIQHLNDTVFSKTFKAPSAWADRELKYKMEKRSWEVELQGFKEQVKSLQEENEGYRAANRAAEFEQNIQVESFSHVGWPSAHYPPKHLAVDGAPVCACL